MAINPNIKNNDKRAMAEVSKNFQEIKNKEKVETRKDENGDNRILIGHQDGGFGTLNYGIKVSQEGVDVRDATDDQLIMSSAFNLPKIVASGTKTVTVPSGGFTAYNYYSASYTHNLGYIPSYFAFFESAVTGGERSPGSSLIVDPSGNVAFTTYIEASATDITFYVAAANSGYSGTYDFKYYLFRETAS